MSKNMIIEKDNLENEILKRRKLNKNEKENSICTKIESTFSLEKHKIKIQKTENIEENIQNDNIQNNNVEYDNIQNNNIEYDNIEIKTILTWNVNSLLVRYNNKKLWKEFVNTFNNIDILCFQEVRLPAYLNKSDQNSIIRSKIKNTDAKSEKDYNLVQEILNNDFKNYNAYFSLANIKYGGQLMLIKKGIQIKSIRYNIDFNLDDNIHNEEGRIILAEFENFFLLSTYTPNNGFKVKSFKRRKLFDDELLKFVEFIKNKKSLIWTGDLNIAPEDVDLSHPIELRRMTKKEDNYIVPKEYIGIPGSTDVERNNFKKILETGNLIDSYRHFENLNNKKNRTINDNIFTWRCNFHKGKIYNKGMRVDHFIVSEKLIESIDKVIIQGYSVNHKNFYGSDHCPVILYFK